MASILEDNIRQFPYTLESVNIVSDLFALFEPQAVNPENDTSPVLNEVTYRGESISRSDFNSFFLSTVSQVPGWESTQVDPNTYKAISSLKDHYLKSQTDSISPTMIDKWQREFWESVSDDKSGGFTKESERQKEIVGSWIDKQKVPTTTAKPVFEDINTPTPIFSAPSTTPSTGQTDQKEKIESNTTPAPAIAGGNDQGEGLSQQVFISPKPNQEGKVITLTDDLQKDIQTLKNELVEKGKEKFSDEMARKIEENLKKSVTAVEAIEFDQTTQKTFAKALSEDLAEKIDSLPDVVEKKVLLRDIGPIAALTNPEASVLYKSPETVRAVSTAVDDLITTHNKVQDIYVDTLTPFIGSAAPILYSKVDKVEESKKYEVTGADKAERLVKVQIQTLNEYVKARNQILSALEEGGMSAKKDDIDKLAWALSRRYSKMQNEGIIFTRSAARNIGQQKQGGGSEMSNYVQDYFFKYFKPTLTATDHGVEIFVNNRSLRTFGGQIGNYASRISATATVVNQGKAAILSKLNAPGVAAEAAVTRAIGGAAGKIAGSAIGGTAVGAALAATLGAAAPIVGHIVGLIVGYIIGKIIDPILIFIKRHWPKILAALAVLYGMAAGVPILMLGGIVGGTVAIVGGATVTTFISGAFAVFIAYMTATTINILRIFIYAIIILAVFTGVIYIINTSALMVPPNIKFGGGGGGGGIVPTDCQDNSYPKPTNVTPLLSGAYADKYAFPIAPYTETSHPCYHWDGEYAVDVFTKSTRLPVVAYTSGTVNMVVMDDSMGGKYVILAGDDGRYYYYAHNCAVYVKQGEKVKVGDVLAVSDTTGSAAGTPEHLHFAINVNNGNTFIGGGGDYCPQTDFEDKFNIGICPDVNTNCVRP
jgi:hypothetical protein